MMVNSKNREKLRGETRLQVRELLESRGAAVEHRDALKAELENVEQQVKEINQELEAVMRANRVGLPGKGNPALEIGEWRLKIIEGENRYVQEKPLLVAMIPLFGDQEDPITATREFLGEYTRVTPYSYVKVTRNEEEERGEEK